MTKKRISKHVAIGLTALLMGVVFLLMGVFFTTPEANKPLRLSAALDDLTEPPLAVYTTVYINGLRLNGGQMERQEFAAAMGQVWANQPFDGFLNSPEYNKYEDLDEAKLFKLIGFTVEGTDELIDHSNFIVDQEYPHLRAIYEEYAVKVSFVYMTTEGVKGQLAEYVPLGSVVHENQWIVELLERFISYEKDGARYLLNGVSLGGRLINDFLNYELTAPDTFVFVYELQRVNLQFVYQSAQNSEIIEVVKIDSGKALGAEFPQVSDFEKDGHAYTFKGWQIGEEFFTPEELAERSFLDNQEIVAVYDVEKISSLIPDPDPKPDPEPEPQPEPLKWYSKVANWFKSLGAPFVSAWNAVAGAWEMLGSVKFAGVELGIFLQVLVGILLLPALLTVFFIAFKILRAVFRLIRIVFRFIWRLFRG